MGEGGMRKEREGGDKEEGMRGDKRERECVYM